MGFENLKRGKTTIWWKRQRLIVSLYSHHTCTCGLTIDTLVDYSTPRQKQYSLLKPYLPKYFSSEWSHSQFRLPSPALPGSRLPSFSIPSANASAPPTAPPTVEDDKCVCTWVDIELSDDEEEETPSYQQTTPTPSATIPRFSSTQQQQQQQSRPSSRGRGSSTSSYPNSLSSSPARGGKHDNVSAPSLRRQSFRSERNSQPTPPPPPQSPKKRTEAQLIAITQSGGWFRVSLTGGDQSDGSASNAKGKGREREGKIEEGVMGLGRDSTNSCRLVEYRRFGTDGW